MVHKEEHLVHKEEHLEHKEEHLEHLEHLVHESLLEVTVCVETEIIDWVSAPFGRIWRLSCTGITGLAATRIGRMMMLGDWLDCVSLPSSFFFFLERDLNFSLKSAPSGSLCPCLRQWTRRESRSEYVLSQVVQDQMKPHPFR